MIEWNNRLFRFTIKSFLWMIAVSMAVVSLYIEGRTIYRSHSFGYDFGFFYYAFQVFWHHPMVGTLYHMSAEQAFMKTLHLPIRIHDQYVYPPQFAMFWCFLGLLPFRVSVLLWLILSVVAYEIAGLLCVKMLWPRLQKKYVVVVLAVASMMAPFQNDVLVGNVNSIVLAGIVITFFLMYRCKRPWWAGVPLGLVILFKVTPLAVLAYLLLRKQWRVGLSAILTCIIFTLLTIWRFGVSAVLHYIVIFPGLGNTSMQNGPAPYNQSLLGFLGLFEIHHWIFISSRTETVLFAIYLVLMALGVIYIGTRIKPNWRIDVALASLTPLLFSPLVEQMHVVYAVPGLLVLMYFKHQQKTEKRSHGWDEWFIGITMILSIVALSLPWVLLSYVIVPAWSGFFVLNAGMFYVLIGLFAAIWLQAVRLKQGY